MSLVGKHIVVSAGGNREPIDPVRYIGNRSSGKMGFALADAAKDRGMRVTLVTTITPPDPSNYDADILIMAAAVADYTIVNPAPNKIKKKGDKLILELVQTNDFLLEVPDTVFKVGFAAETEDLLNNAHKKLVEKRLAFICANDVSAPDAGFAVDTNRITILYKDGRREELSLMSKREAAEKILDRIDEMMVNG